MTPYDFLNWGGWVVAGGFAVYGMWDKATNARHKDADDTATSLINNLKSTVDLQATQLKSYSEKLDQTTKELHLMQGRNSVLESLFNGSENSILAFIKEVPKLTRLTEENNTIAKANSDATTNLTKAITALLTKMTPQSEKTTTTVEKTTAPVSI